MTYQAVTRARHGEPPRTRAAVWAIEALTAPGDLEEGRGGKQMRCGGQVSTKNTLGV